MGLGAVSERENILRVLSNSSGEMCGRDIVKSSDGTVGRGTVYVRLARLEDEGLVSSREERDSHDLPRRWYRLTEAGRRELTEGADGSFCKV